ncbi:hypothetical protein CBL_10864 [Carabus blaptoides fortunei]
MQHLACLRKYYHLQLCVQNISVPANELLNKLIHNYYLLCIPAARLILQVQCAIY